MQQAATACRIASADKPVADIAAADIAAADTAVADTAVVGIAAVGIAAAGTAAGIAAADTIAFGDSSNDLSMLHAAGIGVAMGNASEEVKAACEAVTLSNDQDGVAAYLEQLL